MMNDYKRIFDNFFGGITKFLITYCGYVLVKEGKNSSLFCPNHAPTEKNKKGGNCHSNDEKGVWYCYSCANTGNIYTGSYVEAVMQNMHLDRKEAFKWLCNKVGIHKTIEYSIVDIRKMFVEECHKNLMEKMINVAEYNLAAKYLVNRGFIKRTIESFRMGYSNSSELSELQKKGISTQKLEEAGILRKSKTGKTYNPLRNRIVMMAGDNIYGRDIRKDAYLPHYYTQSHNRIFNEASCLMNQREIIFVVESIYDALTIQQYISRLGENWGVIATLGTKGTSISAIIEFIKKAKPVETIIIPDSDPWFNKKVKHGAGQVAGLKKAMEIEKAGLACRVLTLQEDSDPNDLSKNKVGASAFREMVSKSMIPLQYNIFCASHYYDINNFSGKVAFINKIKAIIGKANEIHLPSELLCYIASLVNLSIQEVKNEFDSCITKNLVLSYFQKCQNKGKSFEEISKHLETL